MRRATAEQLDQLYENLNSEYKLYIRREDLHRSLDLWRRTEEYGKFLDQAQKWH